MQIYNIDLIEKSIFDFRNTISQCKEIINENFKSISLLSKFMTSYGFSKKEKYVRFVHKKYYDILYGNMDNKSLCTIPY